MAENESTVDTLSREVDDFIKSLRNNTPSLSATEVQETAARRDDGAVTAAHPDTANETSEPAVDEDESAESLIARAEQMIEESRASRARQNPGNREPRPATPMPRERDSPTTEVSERFNVSFNALIDTFTQLSEQTQADRVTEEAVLDGSVTVIRAAASPSVSPNVSTVVIADDESDEDVVFVNTVHTESVPVVDLCTPEETHRVKRSRSNRRPMSIDIVGGSSSMQNAAVVPVTDKPVNKPPSSATLLEEKTCAICMDHPFNNQPTSTLCGHIFCYPCIRQALYLYKKCPICNRKLTIKQIHPIFF